MPPFTFSTHPSAYRVAGLYIHVPFCTQRCVYCDFYFVTTSRDTRSFVRALQIEAEAVGAEYGDEPLQTVYLGGGTPSLLPPEDLAAVLQVAHDHFDTSELADVTVEANPEDLVGDAGAAWLQTAANLGVTRVSLGVQSFFEEDLAFMNRAHDASQAEEGVEAVAEQFDDFSVDLIFGVPDQPFEHWGANLEKAVRLGATHLSTYSLTIEDRTPLRKLVDLGRVVPEGDDTLSERYLFTHQYLEERGFEHYEVSSFAKPGHRSKHNQSYWSHANVIGLGPSAHSFYRQTRSRAWRWSNVAHLGRWQGLLLAGERPLEAREAIGPDALADEAILLGLRRMKEGLQLDLLERDYGVDLLSEKRNELAALEGTGLIEVSPDRVRLTPEGATVADGVALRLVG
ncbi:MAG: radical SAM family heme chaperone HemW [Bacteroidota bacterium]